MVALIQLCVMTPILVAILQEAKRKRKITEDEESQVSAKKVKKAATIKPTRKVASSRTIRYVCYFTCMAIFLRIRLTLKTIGSNVTLLYYTNNLIKTDSFLNKLKISRLGELSFLCFGSP